MDIENEILYVGIIAGSLIVWIVMAVVGYITGVQEIIMVIMIGVSAGVLGGIFLIVEIICFFKRYKIVRRE